MRSQTILGIVLAGLSLVGCGAPETPDETVTVSSAEQGLTGGLDIDAWCKHTYGSSAWAGWNGPPYTAYSWVCVVGNASYAPDMQAICVYQYGSNAQAMVGNPQDPYSWYCTYGCTTNGVCGSGNYCKRPNGQCSAVGQCTKIPTGLCFQNTTVCGCNGVTYPGACFAAKGATSIKHAGACP